MPPASAPYPYTRCSPTEPGIQQLSDDLAAAFTPFHAPCGILLNEANHALQRPRAPRGRATASRAR